jgi:hypothetical protein
VRGPSGASDGVGVVKDVLIIFCVEVNTISKQTENEIPFDPCHLEVSSDAPKMIFETIARSA